MTVTVHKSHLISVIINHLPPLIHFETWTSDLPCCLGILTITSKEGAQTQPLLGQDTRKMHVAATFPTDSACTDRMIALHRRVQVAVTTFPTFLPFFTSARSTLQPHQCCTIVFLCNAVRACKQSLWQDVSFPETIRKALLWRDQ